MSPARTATLDRPPPYMLEGGSFSQLSALLRSLRTTTTVIEPFTRLIWGEAYDREERIKTFLIIPDRVRSPSSHHHKGKKIEECDE